MPPNTDEVVRFMSEVASRAVGGHRGDPRDRTSGEPIGIGSHLATADLHKDAGLELGGPTRMAAFKRLVLRVLRPYATSQAAYNRAVLAALHSLSHNIGAVQVDVDERLGRTQATLTSTELFQQQSVRDIQRRLARLDEHVESVRASLAETADKRVADHGELALQRARIELFLAEARQRLPEPFDREQLERLTGDADSWLAPLYAQLEEAFRGSRDEIYESQKEYLADIVAVSPTAPVVDIGCGRGEWLELLGHNGIPAYGVDTNEAFVQRNRDRGLDVRHEDAISHLTGLQPGTVGAVTAFHVVEHLEFPDAVRMIDSALVALRPGGTLIFETPNPTNIVVGTSAFYLDPTHRNPLHPELLRFLVEARGFVDVEVRYLHASRDSAFALPDDDAPQLRRVVEHLNWAFFGPLDFAVIGRKAKPAS